MQEFAVASEKWHLMIQSEVFFRKPYRISVKKEFCTYTLVQNLASKLQLRNSEMSSHNSDLEAAQRHTSFLVAEGHRSEARMARRDDDNKNISLS